MAQKDRNWVALTQSLSSLCFGTPISSNVAGPPPVVLPSGWSVGARGGFCEFTVDCDETDGALPLGAGLAAAIGRESLRLTPAGGGRIA